MPEPYVLIVQLTQKSSAKFYISGTQGTTLTD